MTCALFGFQAEVAKKEKEAQKRELRSRRKALRALCKVGGAHWALCKVGGAHWGHSAKWVGPIGGTLQGGWGPWGRGGGQGTGMLSLLHCFLLRREVTSVGQTVTWHSTCRTWSCSARSWMHSGEHSQPETGWHLLLVVPTSSLSHPAHLTLLPHPLHSPALPTSIPPAV